MFIYIILHILAYAVATAQASDGLQSGAARYTAASGRAGVLGLSLRAPRINGDSSDSGAAHVRAVVSYGVMVDNELVFIGVKLNQET